MVVAGFACAKRLMGSGWLSGLPGVERPALLRSALQWPSATARAHDAAASGTAAGKATLPLDAEICFLFAIIDFAPGTRLASIRVILIRVSHSANRIQRRRRLSLLLSACKMSPFAVTNRHGSSGSRCSNGRF